MRARELESRLSGDSTTPLVASSAFSRRHKAALAFKVGPNPSCQQALARMLRGWAEYADATRALYAADPDEGVDAGLGHVLGPHWEAIGHAIHGLLNGETGDIDCGHISKVIIETIGE